MIARYRSSFAAATGFVAARPPARVVEAGRVARAAAVKPTVAHMGKRVGRAAEQAQRSLKSTG